MLFATPTHPPWPSWLSDAPWPPHIMPAIGCDDRGLVVGSGTQLVRMGDKGRLAVEPDAARCIALLSVLGRRPVAAEVLRPIEAAAAYWAAGDKALANLRLVFSGLPKLRSITDAACLEAAAWCLDQGLAPRDLMKALDLDPAVLDLRKYDPDQPRVPAGCGRESGRWTDQPNDETIGGSILSSPPGEIRVAANGPFKPDGIEATPSQPIDPLDPANLNKQPPTPQEQQAIADALSIIINGSPEDTKKLQPHPYQNLPEKSTGAMLPPDPQGYTSYNVTSGAERGQARIVVNGSNTSAYYTSNHYKSFFGVDMMR